MNATTPPSLTIRCLQASQRQKYAAFCALEKAYGLRLDWEEVVAMGDRTSLHWGEVELASWRNHPVVTDHVTEVGPMRWDIWEREGEVQARLMLPGFVDDPEIEASSLPFDPLAATFHALTCWDEQHGRLDLDEHGRPTTGALAWQGASGEVRFGTRIMPMSDQHRWPWVEVMWHAILSEVDRNASPSLSFRPTFDVDVAFKHLGRPRWKTWMLQSRDLVMGRWSLVRERSQTLRGRLNDPYDTYGWIRGIHAGREDVGWFVLAADRKAPFDIGLNPRLDVLPALVASLSQRKDTVGWHPSYAAMDDEGVRQHEKARFQSWHGADAQVARTHFLRGQPGAWWRESARLGIKADASLGWAREVGFRAGFSQAYPAYDVHSESTLNVMIHPMAVMDTALKSIMNSPEEAQQCMRTMMEVVSDVGGTWMSCWHNTSVSEDGEWEGWRSTYLHMVESARELGGRTLEAWNPRS